MAIRTALAVSLAASALIAVSLVAHAETPVERQACTDDAFQHCGEFIPDRERVYQCLARKKKTISSVCRKVMSKPSNVRR